MTSTNEANNQRRQPAYMRIAADIRNAIRSGALHPHDPVPSAAALCEQYGVSMMTTKSALNLLRTEGFVYGVSGKATYVAEKTKMTRTAPHRYFQQAERTYIQEAEYTGRTPHAEHLTQIITAPPWLAHRLDIEPNDEVIQTYYKIFADNQPMSMSTSWEPRTITRNTPIEYPHEGPHANDGLNTRFASIGWIIEQVEERIVIRSPSDIERKELAIPDDVPIAEIQQTVRATQTNTDNLVPIEAADIIFPADRYELRYLMDRPR